MSVIVYEERRLRLSVKPVDLEAWYDKGESNTPLPSLIRMLVEAPAGSVLGKTAVDSAHCAEYPRPKVEQIGPHTWSVELCVPENPGYAAMVAGAKHAFTKAGWSAEVL